MGVDGFAFNASIVDQSGAFAWPAVTRLRAVVADPRRWRPRYYPVPPAGLPIAAKSDHIEQLAIRPGSLLYGYSFATLDGSAALDYLVQVSFDAETTTLWSKPVLASAVRPSGAIRPVLLTEPKLIVSAGVSVRIWNSAAAARTCQLVLCCAEPWGNDE